MMQSLLQRKILQKTNISIIVNNQTKKIDNYVVTMTYNLSIMPHINRDNILCYNV